MSRDSRCGGHFVLLLVLAIPLFSNLSWTQQPALATHRNLAQLTDESSKVVHATVVSSRMEPHPTLTNLQTVVVTLRVHDTLKGAASPTLTFRQYVWDVRARYNRASYVKGQEVVAFLRPASRLGLTSPAGLQQGWFVVKKDARGHATAINGQQNIGLFDRIDVAASSRKIHLSAPAQKLAQTRGPVDLEEFKKLVRSFAKVNQ
jgi:hypothetical protein